MAQQIEMSPPHSNDDRAKDHHHHHVPPTIISPSPLRNSVASRPMSYTDTVGEVLYPLDTPGHLPDETSQRKSYAAVLTSRAADKEVSPLGQDKAAWPPLASMAIDPPPKLFVQKRDRGPPDRPSAPPSTPTRTSTPTCASNTTTPTRRRRPRTRRNKNSNSPSYRPSSPSPSHLHASRSNRITP